MLSFFKRLFNFTRENKGGYAANEIKYIYVYLFVNGITWGQVITSNKFNEYNEYFNGQLHQREATRAETLEYIRRDIERL